MASHEFRFAEHSYPFMGKHRREALPNPKLRERARDPRYASVMLWNWQLCKDCGSLVPRCCTQCGGTSFNTRPRDIMRAALNQHGYPPPLHPSNTKT
jgi:hypothetical protein